MNRAIILGLCAGFAGMLGTVSPAGEFKAPSIVISETHFKIVGQDREQGNIAVTAYNSESSLLYRPFVDYSSFEKLKGTSKFIFATDLNGLPVPARVTKVKYDEEKRFIDPYIVNLVVPLNRPIALEIPYWPLPGYGRVWLRADNAGAGFRVDGAGKIKIINLNYEMARTYQASLTRRLAEIKGTYSIPSMITDASVQAARLLEAAEHAADEEERAAQADKALVKLLDAGDDLEFDIAKQRIPAARKGRLTLTVTDEAGLPLKDAAVEMRQVTHDFLFGLVQSFGFVKSELTDTEIKNLYKQAKDAGFNHFTASLFWDQLEKERGNYNFSQWEKKLGVPYAVENGMSLKLHGLMQESLPKYVKKGDAPELFQSSTRYFEAALDYFRKNYGDSVQLIEAINEPSTNDYIHLGQDKKLDLIRNIVGTIRRKWPGKQILINDVEADYGERYGESKDRRHVISPYEMFKFLNDKGVDYDAMGLEWYPGLRVNFFGILQLEGPLKDFMTTSAALDHYAPLGKPLHITEFTVPSTFDDDWKSGWWRKPWTPEVQADYVKRFYTVAFSKPYVHEITYWGITDNEPWVIGGGLFDKSLQPKAAFGTLRQLIEGWTTQGKGVTDAQGKITWDGYGGWYEITIIKGNMRKQWRLHLEERKQRDEHLALTS